MKEIYDLFLRSNGVCTDSRKLKKNQLYFALKGEHYDGHQFIEEAHRKGAIGCIIDNSTFTGSYCIIVKDVLKALQQLANIHRRHLNTPILAITGSNGKTTSKKITSQILSNKYKIIATKGNLNNHIGVPLSLLEIKKETELAIIEMGANHQKEIEFLCSITEPNFGYITNFGKAHLEGFGGLKGVIKGKSELYKYIIKTKGLLFVNHDDPIQLEKSERANCVYFGSEKFNKVAYKIKLVSSSPTVKISVNSKVITTSLIGKYNFGNIAAGLAIGLHFGIELDKIKQCLENFEPEGNRSQIIKTEKNKILLDAYNANPTSMEAAIDNFNAVEAADKVLILGDMFEIGATTKAEHQKIASLARVSAATKVYLCGKHFTEAVESNQKTVVTEDTLQLKELLRKIDIKNTFILVKGSRGMALERLLEVL